MTFGKLGISACLQVLLLALLGPLPAVATDTSQLVAPETVFQFGQVRMGEKVVHPFPLKNTGKKELHITGVEVGGGRETTLLVKKSINPGEEIKAILSLNTAGMKGAVETGAIIHTDDPQRPKVELKMQGQVKPPTLEFEPLAAIFLAAFKDEPLEKSLTIINNEEKPVDIFGVVSESKIFQASLEKVKPGKEFKLLVKVNPNIPYGKYQDHVLLYTDHPDYQEVEIPVNIFLKNDVYTFPDAVNFGKVSLKDLKKDPLFMRQTILVKRRPGKGKDFQITTEPKLPFIQIVKEPAEGSETYRLDVDLEPEKLKRGKINTFIKVKTNDKEVPDLKIPVKGEII